MSAFTLLLVAFLAVSSTSERCEGINAQLNVFYKEFDTNSLRDLSSPDGVRLLAIDRWQKFVRKTMRVESEGSTLWGMDMIYHAMDTVTKWKIIDDAGVKAFSNASKQSSYLYSMSDSQIVDYRPPSSAASSKVGAAIVIVVDTVVDPQSHEQYDRLHYFYVLATDKALSLNQKATGHIRKVYPYVYPWATAQDVYDQAGHVVGKEQMHAIDADSIVPDPKMVRQSRVQFLRKPTAVNLVEFVTFAYTQKSLKLIHYTWHVEFSEPNVEEALMIVPQIQGFESNQVFTAFMKVLDGRIYLITAIHQAQVAAFDALHPGFDVAGQIGQVNVAPFLIVVNTNNGTSMRIETVVNVMKEDAAPPKTGTWPTDLDIRGDKVLVVGNTYMFDSRKKRNLTDAHKPWYSVITLAEGQQPAVTTSWALYDLKKYAEKLHGIKQYTDLTFNAFAASWPVEGDTDRFVVGGSLLSYTQEWYNKGRAYLIETATGKDVASTPIGLSDNLSNLLKEIYVVKKADKLTMFFNIYEGGPKELPPPPPSKDKHRFFDGDIWQVDCTLPNEKLEKAAVIVFYCFVGVATLMFLFAVTFFIGKAIFQCRKKATQSEEETQHLMEGQL